MYIYTKQPVGKYIDKDNLRLEINNNAGIIAICYNIEYQLDADFLRIFFVTTPAAGELTALETLITDHESEPSNIVYSYTCLSCDGAYDNLQEIDDHLVAEPNHLVIPAYKNKTGDGKQKSIHIKRPDGTVRKLKVSDTDVLTVEA